MLAPSNPLKCTSPADVYLFLKSSDFVAHDLDPATVFEGCVDQEEVPDKPLPSYELELVLKKWYNIETSRELRCFVRENILIGGPPYHLDIPNTHNILRQVSPNAIRPSMSFSMSHRQIKPFVML